MANAKKINLNDYVSNEIDYIEMSKIVKKTFMLILLSQYPKLKDFIKLYKNVKLVVDAIANNMIEI